MENINNKQEFDLTDVSEEVFAENPTNTQSAKSTEKEKKNKKKKKNTYKRKKTMISLTAAIVAGTTMGAWHFHCEHEKNVDLEMSTGSVVAMFEEGNELESGIESLGFTIAQIDQAEGLIDLAFDLNDLDLTTKTEEMNEHVATEEEIQAITPDSVKEKLNTLKDLKGSSLTIDVKRDRLYNELECIEDEINVRLANADTNNIIAAAEQVILCSTIEASENLKGCGDFKLVKDETNAITGVIFTDNKTNKQYEINMDKTPVIKNLINAVNDFVVVKELPEGQEQTILPDTEYNADNNKKLKEILRLLKLTIANEYTIDGYSVDQTYSNNDVKKLALEK